MVHIENIGKEIRYRKAERLKENLLLNQLIEKWAWYFILVGLGFEFRIALYNPFITDKSTHRKKVICQIGTEIFIMYMLGRINSINNLMCTAVVALLFYGYCIYALLQKLQPKGHTNSSLVIINGYLVTAFSFMSFPANIVMLGICLMLSILAYCIGRDEKLYDFCEIIILCVEGVIVSIFVWEKEIDGLLEIAAVVLFVETAIYTLNCFLKGLLIKRCGGDIDKYFLNLSDIYID